MSDISSTTYEKLRQTNSATLSSLLFRRGLRNTAVRGVKALRPDATPMVGPAVTVRYIPAREDIEGANYSSSPDNYQRKAIDTIPAGHVLVLDCRGVVDVAGIGAVLARRLVYRGCAGLVLDGGVRDTVDIAGLGLPTFCAGPAAPANLVAHHASDMNQPIACGGVAVYPDDVIFGDAEAVIVIPRKWADEIAEEAAVMDAHEEFIKLEIEGGRPTLGAYPPNEEALLRYEQWKRERT